MVVRFPAGPRVSLKTVDPPKGNGLGQKKKNPTRGSLMAPSVVCSEFQCASTLANVFMRREIVFLIRACENCALSSSEDVLAPLAVRGMSSMSFCAWLTS